MRLLTLALLANLCGCYTFHDCISNSAMSARNCWDAHTAWLAYRGEFVDCSPYPVHFGCGFKQGYEDVANGSDGCPPTLPPRKYWGVCYQTATGRCQTVEWFNGYVAGAAVALKEGVQNRSRLVTSDEVFHRGAHACPMEIVTEPIPADGPLPAVEGEDPAGVHPFPYMQGAPLVEPRPGGIEPPRAPGPFDPLPIDAARSKQEKDASSTEETPKQAGLPAPPLAELPRPGERIVPTSLARDLWRSSGAKPWFEYQSQRTVTPAVAAEPEEVAGHTHLSTLEESSGALEGSIDATETTK